MFYATRGSGPTLVFLHGGGDSGEHSFVRQLDVFSEQHHIVAPDQVGQGRTPDVPGPLSYTAMMQDTAALLQQLKLKHVDVVGFSDGGILGLMLAVRHPDLVRRLVISGVEFLRKAWSPRIWKGCAPTIPRRRRPSMRSWVTSGQRRPRRMSQPCFARQIKQPVLLVSGDHDVITLEHTLQIFHALPNSELCVLPGTDHGTFSSRPEWLNPIIGAFLARPQEAVATVR